MGLYLALLLWSCGGSLTLTANAFSSATEGIRIADDNVTNYEFPSLCVTDNGDLLMGCRHGNKSHLFDKGDAVVFRSSDKGLTWDNGYVAVTDNTYDISAVALTKLRSGRIIGVYFKGNTSTTLSVSLWTFYSDNNGIQGSWSAPSQIDNGARMEPNSLAHVYELDNGAILLPYQACDIAGFTNAHLRLAISTDNGASFVDWVDVVNEVGYGPKWWGEAALFPLPNGNLRIMALDSEDGAGSSAWPSPGGPTYKNWTSFDSSDNGATWGSGTERFHANAHPEVIRTSSGKYVAAIGRRDSQKYWTYLPSLRFSDDGTTWTGDNDEVIVDTTLNGGSYSNTTWYGTYADVVEVSPGLLAVAYSAIYWPDVAGNCYGFIRMKHYVVSNTGIHPASMGGGASFQ